MRRTFLRTWGLVLALSLVVACQPAAAPGPQGTASATSAATASAAAAPEGTFTIANDSLGVETFDPSLSPGSALYYFRLMYDPLIGPDEFGRPSRDSGIASDWKFSDDKMALTLTLREGLVFHDGSPVTSADVKFSVEHAMRKDARGSFAPYLREFIQSVEAPDAKTVIVRHTKPTGLTVEYLGPTHTESMVLPKAYFERVGPEGFQKAPIGSGPYRVVEQILGSSITFGAADKSSGLRLPTKEQVVVRLVKEESSRKALLQTGGADLINVTTDIADELRQAGFPIVTTPGALQLQVLMHLQANGAPIGDEYPLSDVRVREAMSLAIDRGEIAEFLFRGFAKPTTAFRTFGNLLESVGSSHDAFNDPYDPEKAKQLLKEAGYPERFGAKAKIDFYAHPHGGLGEWQDYTALLANFWRAVGLDINYRTGEYGVWRDAWTAQSIPGAVAFLAIDVSQSSWTEQLVAYRSFMAPQLPRALVWDMKLAEMLAAVEPAGQDDPAKGTQLLVDIARYTKDRYAPGFSVVTLDGTYGISKSYKPWTPRKIPYALGDFEQVVTRSK